MRKIGRGLRRISSTARLAQVSQFYCISSETQSDGCARLEKQLKGFGAPIRQVLATSNENVDIDKLIACGLVARNAFDDGDILRSRASVGRALSHMLVWKDMIQKRATIGEDLPAVILEDSCAVLDTFSEDTLIHRLACLPSDWKCVRLSEQGGGAAAYVMTAVGAKAALGASVPICEIDSLFRDDGILGGHIISPPLVAVNEFPDDSTVTVLNEDPLIITIDGALSPGLVSDLRRSFEELERSSDGRKTNTYVDDIFDSDTRVADDANLMQSVAASGVYVPSEYSNDPLRAFLWLVANHKETLAPGDVAAALFIVQKRAFQAKWESDPRGLQILADSGFQNAATRWKLPDHIRCLLRPLLMNVFGCGARGVPGSDTDSGPCQGGSEVSWEVHDATMVKYKSGQSQVPHMDTADVTLLTYLSDFGGSTRFPNLKLKVQPKAGRTLVFFSTRPETRAALDTGELPVWDTLHYGELAEEDQKDGKLVAQVLLSATDMGSARGWRDTLRGRFFAKGIPEPSRWEPYPESTNKVEKYTLSSISLSEQRCAYCNEKALDMKKYPGSPMYCLSCWSKSLEQTLKDDALA